MSEAEGGRRKSDPPLALEPAAPPAGWGLPLASVGVLLQVMGLVLGTSVLITSVVPPFQSWVSSRQVALTWVQLPLTLSVILYLPLIGQVWGRYPPTWNWREIRAQLADLTWVLMALGLALGLVGLFLPGPPIPAAGRTPEYWLAHDLHWVRVQALLLMSMDFVWLGVGYNWRWLAHHRPRRSGASASAAAS